MDLQKELQEVIEKNLPKATGTALQKRLKEADKFEEENKLYLARGESIEKENKKLEERLEIYKELDVRNSKISKRETEVTEREHKIELADIKNQLEAAKDKTQFCKEVALGLVRNTEYRTSLFHRQNPGGTPIIDGQGNAHYTTDVITDHSETKKAE